ncbi:hypothetical protein MASR1M12_23930 [Erysipelotrichia bacterium]
MEERRVFHVFLYRTSLYQPQRGLSLSAMGESLPQYRHIWLQPKLKTPPTSCNTAGSGLYSGAGSFEPDEQPDHQAAGDYRAERQHFVAAESGRHDVFEVDPAAGCKIVVLNGQMA